MYQNHKSGSSDDDNLFVTAAQSLYDSNGIRHNCGQFFPSVYNFRVKNHKDLFVRIDNDKCSNGRVQCPEFHIIFDHTLAILWMCFSKKVEASPAQIRWAVKFLEGLTNDHGETSTDVRFAIDHLNNLILSKYNSVPETKLRPSTSEPSLSKLAPSTSKQTISFTLNDMLQKLYPEKLIQLLSFGGSYVGSNSPTLPESNPQNIIKPSSSVFSWKQDQVGQITKEIQRLKSIDQMMDDLKAERVINEKDLQNVLNDDAFSSTE